MTDDAVTLINVLRVKPGKQEALIALGGIFSGMGDAIIGAMAAAKGFKLTLDALSRHPYMIAATILAAVFTSGALAVSSVAALFVAIIMSLLACFSYQWVKP